MGLSSVAFFFDADHEGLKSSWAYGPPCTGKIVETLLSLSDAPATRIDRGDLLIHNLCYEIGAVEAKQEWGRMTHSHTLQPNYDLLQLAVCEFHSTLVDGRHSFDRDAFLMAIAKRNIWTIVVSHARDDDVEVIDKHAKQQLAYLGWAEIDWGNPLHRQLFSLLGGAYVADGKLYCEDDPETGESAQIMADGYGVSSPATMLPVGKFSKSVPRVRKSGPLSKRGALTKRRLEGKSDNSHGARVAQAVLEALHKGEISEPIRFEAGEAARDFEVDEKKLTEYLLNPAHVKGAAKARFFSEVLDIQESDWRYLRDQILEGVKRASLYRFTQTQHGFQHGAYIPVTGINGRTVVLTTAWIIRADGTAYFVTAYPTDEDTAAKTSANASNIVPPNLEGAARWTELHRLAHEAGQAAAAAAIPTPMVLHGYAPIMSGPCGFAWTHIDNGRHSFSAWLRKNSIGHRNHRKGWDVWADPPTSAEGTYDSQSIEPKKAYAEAYAEVLRRNGVDSIAESRLD